MARKKSVFESIFKRIGLSVYDFSDFDECMLALQDKDPENRIKAIEELVPKHHMDDITPIINVMLKDKNFQVQEAAMNALGDLKREEAVEPLITMLRASDQWLRVKAAMILIQIGDTRALQPIIDAAREMKGEYRSTVERLIPKLEALKFQKAKFPEPPPAAWKTPAGAPAPAAPPADAPAGAPPQAAEPAAKPFSRPAARSYEEPVEVPAREDREIPAEAPVRAPESEPELLTPSTPAEQEGSRRERAVRRDYEDFVQSRVKAPAPVQPAPQEDKLEEKLRFQLSRASSSRADEKIVEYYYNALVHGDQSAEEALCSYLKGPTDSARLQALQALSEIERKPHIVNALLEILNECSDQMCWRVIVALCGVQDLRVAEKVLPYLGDVDKKIRKFAENYFLIYPHQEMIDVLLADYAVVSENTRIERASLIARMDSEDAKPALAQLLQDQNQPEKVILAILDKLPPRQEDVIVASLPALIKRKEETLVDSLPRRLRDKNNLLLMEYLRQNLTGGKYVIRGRAAFLLGHLKDVPSSMTIASLLEDSSEYVRLKAAKALFALKSRDYYNALCNALRAEPNLRNKLEYIQIIDQLHRDRVLELFIDLLQDSTPEVRYLLLEHLSKRAVDAQEKEKIINTVQVYLEDADIRVVFYTIVLLAKLGSRKFSVDRHKLLSVLWTIIRDERNPSKIRREALFSMLYLSKEDTREVLKSIVKKDSDDEIRIQSAYYLANFDGDDVIDSLEQASRSPKKNVASAAMETIRKIQAKKGQG